MQIFPMPTLWTLGHGNRELAAFLALLQAYDINILVDIRTHPVSTRHPWFDEASLREELQAKGISYHWAGKAFGGLRRAQPHSRHHALAGSASAQGFADHMDTAFFQRSATQLIALARKGRTALLCAEIDYRQCHRRLLADYLCLAGCEVIHIEGENKHCEHQLSAELRYESADVIYDRLSNHTLDF